MTTSYDSRQIDQYISTLLKSRTNYHKVLETFLPASLPGKKLEELIDIAIELYKKAHCPDGVPKDKTVFTEPALGQAGLVISIGLVDKIAWPIPSKSEPPRREDLGDHIQWTVPYRGGGSVVILQPKTGEDRTPIGAVRGSASEKDRKEMADYARKQTGIQFVYGEATEGAPE